jgi:oligoribonuclease
MKYVSIDIETTGLDPETCQIVELAAVIEDTKDQIEIEKLPCFHCYVLPEKGNLYTGQPYALFMHSEIFRKIERREHPHLYFYPGEIVKNFKKFCDDNKLKFPINVAGKNFGCFDHQFLLRQAHGWKDLKVRHRFIDPATLYFEKDDEAIPGTELCLKRAGFDPKTAHTAKEDAIAVIQLLRKKFQNG